MPKNTNIAVFNIVQLAAFILTMVCSTSEEALSKSWHCKKVVGVTNAKIFDGFDNVFKYQRKMMLTLKE